MLLFSLLLAFSIWLIHNLSLKDTADVTVMVEAHSNIEGRSDVSSNVVSVTAECYATGFNLLRANWFLKNKIRPVVFDAEHLQYDGGDSYSIGEKALAAYSKDIFGSHLRVEVFRFESITFEFAVNESKTVPVQFVGELSCKPQYMMEDDIHFTPDSITLTGEPRVLEKITSVSTMPLYLLDMDKDHSGTIKLRPIKDARMSTKPVSYSIEVTRYVEMSETYPLTVTNLPDDKVLMLIPDAVEVRFRVPFQSGINPTANASFHVDYADFLKSVSGKCIVRADREMPGVISWSAEPELVECIVGDK